MTNSNSDQITGNIAIAVLPQANGHYICRLSPSVDGLDREDRECYGQSQEHAIAIALEQLAYEYRRIAEEKQNIDLETVEYSESGAAIEQQYHVILHYETIAEEESKFFARVETMMGNTVVENAIITVIKIDPLLADLVDLT
jgi:hypothetical protein